MTTSNTPGTISLRERKKQQTRDAIVTASLDLFTEQGFHDTTLAQIAEAANVAPRTLFLYFPSKGAIVFDISQRIIDELESYLNQYSHQPTFAVLRQFCLEKLYEEDTFSHFTIQQLQQYNRLLSLYPELRDYATRFIDRVETMLGVALARQFKLPTDSLAVRLTSATARTAVAYLLDYRLQQLSREKIIHIIDTTIKFAEAGMEATAVNKKMRRLLES